METNSKISIRGSYRDDLNRFLKERQYHVRRRQLRGLTGHIAASK